MIKSTHSRGNLGLFFLCFICDVLALCHGQVQNLLYSKSKNQPCSFVIKWHFNLKHWKCAQKKKSQFDSFSSLLQMSPEITNTLVSRVIPYSRLYRMSRRSVLSVFAIGEYINYSVELSLKFVSTFHHNLHHSRNPVMFLHGMNEV